MAIGVLWNIPYCCVIIDETVWKRWFHFGQLYQYDFEDFVQVSDSHFYSINSGKQTFVLAYSTFNDITGIGDHWESKKIHSSRWYLLLR
jgi:hypothetical protein